MLTALSMAAGLAHLFALPAKIGLGADDYLVVQQIYRGWAFLGIAVIGALVTTVWAAILLRGRPAELRPMVVAAICIALALTTFFLFTFPANQQTANWTTLPSNWEMLRTNWEYSHAAGAILFVIALGAHTWSLLAEQT